MDLVARYKIMRVLEVAVDKMLLSAAENPQSVGFRPKLFDAQLMLTYDGTKLETHVHPAVNLLRPEVPLSKMLNPIYKVRKFRSKKR
jgi:hypothetical protein